MRLFTCSMHANVAKTRFSGFCHTIVSISDKTCSINRRILPMLTGFVIGFSASLAIADEGDLLEAATIEAVHQCIAAGTASIEECGNLQGRSREASMARRSVIRYMQARGQLIAACGKTSQIDCVQLAAWHTQVGINSALTTPSNYSH